jgi:hypothetical protein
MLPSHNENDTKSSFQRETNADDGAGWYFDTYAYCLLCSNRCLWKHQSCN